MFYFAHAATTLKEQCGMNVVIEEVSELLNSTHGVAVVPIVDVLRIDTRIIEEVKFVPVGRRVPRGSPVVAVCTSSVERRTIAALACSGEEYINTMVCFLHELHTIDTIDSSPLSICVVIQLFEIAFRR